MGTEWRQQWTGRNKLITPYIVPCLYSVAQAAAPRKPGFWPGSVLWPLAEPSCPHFCPHFCPHRGRLKMTRSGRHLRGLTHWEVTIDVISPQGLRNLPYRSRGHNITVTYLGGAFGLQSTFTHLCNCPGGPGKAPGQAQLSKELFARQRSHCQQSRQAGREASYHIGTGKQGGWGGHTTQRRGGVSQEAFPENVTLKWKMGKCTLGATSKAGADGGNVPGRGSLEEVYERGKARVALVREGGSGPLGAV